MKFNLDENLGVRTRQVFLEAGGDVQTVREEGLQGHTDDTIYEMCRIERRCLVTLDLDFSNVLRFPPEPTAGIAVLRPGRVVAPGILTTLARQLVAMMASQPVEGQVWIVEPGRVRIHQSASV